MARLLLQHMIQDIQNNKGGQSALIEDIIRDTIDTYDNVPEPIKQAALILVGTLYEERQVSKNDKEGLSLKDTLDLVRRMLFAYRKDKF